MPVSATQCTVTAPILTLTARSTVIQLSSTKARAHERAHTHTYTLTHTHLQAREHAEKTRSCVENFPLLKNGRANQ